MVGDIGQDGPRRGGIQDGFHEQGMGGSGLTCWNQELNRSSRHKSVAHMIFGIETAWEAVIAHLDLGRLRSQLAQQQLPSWTLL